MTDAITDADIKIFMATVCKHPIKGLVERADSWSLGSASVRISKRHPLFNDGFSCKLRPESHFYKRWFEFPDTGARGWAIVFQVFPPIDPPKERSEYMCGWVPPERAAEADGWIAILDSEIHARLIAAGIQPRPPTAPTGPVAPTGSIGTSREQVRATAADVAAPPSTMDDDRHVRYMLSVGPRAVIATLYETRDARGFGGTLWMNKFHPLYKLGSGTDPSGDIKPLRPESHFCKRWFSLADTGERGWVIYFKPTATRTEVCGWVPPEREAEAEGWIATLNADIHARLIAVGIQPQAPAVATPVAAGPSAPAPAADPRVRATVQGLRALGLAVPDATTMDDLITQLEQWSQADGPIDARSKGPKSSS